MLGIGAYMMDFNCELQWSWCVNLHLFCTALLNKQLKWLGHIHSKTFGPCYNCSLCFCVITAPSASLIYIIALLILSVSRVRHCQ